MIGVLDISKYVIFEYNKQGAPITNLKLQKILYYIQGYAYRNCNSGAFPETIYKWPYGPVVPEAYFSYNCYRSNSIPDDDADSCLLTLKKINQDKGLKNVIQKVVQKSIPMSASELVAKTHGERPWMNTRDSKQIPAQEISSYFIGHDPLNLGEL